MITIMIRRVLPIVGLLVLMGAVVRQVHLPVPGGDLFFHLRFGSEFRDGWSVSSPGHLSPFDTAEWVPTQWLAQIGMSWLVDAWGLRGIMWVSGVLIFALIIIVYRMCRAQAAPLPAALSVGLALLAVAPGLSARPQLLSFLLIAIVTDAWLRTARDGRARWWLIAIAWVWPMLHGMWSVGIIIGAAAVAGMALDRSLPRDRLVRLAAIPAASALVPLASPVGWNIYTSLFEVGSRSSYFAEWSAPAMISRDLAPLMALLVIVGLVSLKATRLTWIELLLYGQAVVWALYTLRTGCVAAILLAPLLATSLQHFLPSGNAMTRGEWTAILGGAVVASAALFAVAGPRANEPVVPSWLDDRLDALPPDAEILNEWDTGAYFLWRHPDLSLVMHGYGDVFTDDEIKRNVDITRLMPQWDAQVVDLEVDYALQSKDTQLTYGLTEHLGWTVVEGDEKFVLLAPPP